MNNRYYDLLEPTASGDREWQKRGAGLLQQHGIFRKSQRI
jgi:hypothetical protein